MYRTLALSKLQTHRHLPCCHVQGYQPCLISTQDLSSQFLPSPVPWFGRRTKHKKPAACPGLPPPYPWAGHPEATRQAVIG